MITHITIIKYTLNMLILRKYYKINTSRQTKITQLKRISMYISSILLKDIPTINY